MEPISVRSGLRISVHVLYFIFVVGLCGGAAIHAQINDIWLGGSGNWSNASSWSNGVPNGNFNVYIDNGNPAGSLVTLDMSPSIVNLTIDSDDGIKAGGPFTGGTFTLATNSVTNQGWIHVLNGTQLVVSGTLDNQGTIYTDRIRPHPPGQPQVQLTGGLTNTGTLAPGKGALINISGPFSNFSGTTLKGGIYKVDKGSLTVGVPPRKYLCTLQFNNANIVTNSANISIVAGSQIIDQGGNNALRNFANNTSGAVFALLGNLTLAVPTDFTNAGTMRLRGSFQVNSYTQTAGITTGGLTATATYTQTGGTTELRYLRAPGGSTIKAGTFFGGDIESALTSSGSVTPGTSPKKPGTLDVTAYTQNAAGSLNIGIRGTTQYGQLAATNGASLNGTLNIKLINGFVPAIGDSFTIVTGSTITGQFATVNGLSINGNEHFEITYNPTNVTLTVVSGAD